jgi:hypothetical protein
VRPDVVPVGKRFPWDTFDCLDPATRFADPVYFAV